LVCSVLIKTLKWLSNFCNMVVSHHKEHRDLHPEPSCSALAVRCNSRFVSVVNEHESKWRTQEHKEIIWKICVLHIGVATCSALVNIIWNSFIICFSVRNKHLFKMILFL
jgi:hypothetical protein